jgi:carboxyl-terminal processing protease
VLLIAGCGDARSVRHSPTPDSTVRAAAGSTSGGAPLDVIRQAYDEITGQLFREVTPRDLLAPAWRAIAVEARRQSGSEVGVSEPIAAGSSDFDSFAREFTAFVAGPARGLDATLLARAAVRGMTAAVGDSHTRYLTPEQEDDSRRAAGGDVSYIGIGVTLSDRNTIAEVYSNSPAERAGLRAGDRIVRVNGRDMEPLSRNDISQQVRGPEGTEVQITIQRGDEGLFDITVARARVILPVVSARMLDAAAGIGYIQVASLPGRSLVSDVAREFDEQLARLIAQGTRGLVLDLRRNPGGDPFTAVAIASNFVPDGPIFYSVNREGRRTAYPSTSRPTLFQGPVAVLVDRGTASGAEVIASALQEYGVGYLIGTRTCGCLSVGRPLQLGDSSGLIVTVERAFTGRLERSLEGVGLTPDRAVAPGDATLDPQRQSAIAYLLPQLR